MTSLLNLEPHSYVIFAVRIICSNSQFGFPVWINAECGRPSDCSHVLPKYH